MIDVVFAFLAGVVTLAAPCILPLLPIVFGASMRHENSARPIFIALGFVFSFSAVALVLGALSDALGFSPDVLRNVATVALFLFGTLMILPSLFARLSARLSGLINHANQVGVRTNSGNAGGFVLGTTLGIVWTPCAGPVLGSILTLVATSQDQARATLLLVAYAIGASVPMLVIAYGGQYISTRVRSVSRYARRLQQGFGGVVMLFAIALHYQYDTVVNAWLSDLLPCPPTRTVTRNRCSQRRQSLFAVCCSP